MARYSVTAEERNQIEQAVTAYCRGLDRFDREIALSAFAPGAVLNYSGVYVGDAPGFMDWVWPFHERLDLNIHRVANVFIDRNSSGHLVSESYVTSLLRRRDGDAFVDRVGYGRYIDRWVETGNGLATAEREYVNDLVTELTNPAEAKRAVPPADGVPVLERGATGTTVYTGFLRERPCRHSQLREHTNDRNNTEHANERDREDQAAQGPVLPGA